MPRAFLFHWHKAEALERARRLRALGFAVAYEHEDGARGGRRVRDRPPDVVVVDLSRLPSHGRETAHYFRSTKATRDIPILFVDGAPEKVRATRAKVPDATFTTWQAVPAILRGLARPSPTGRVRRQVL